MGTYTRLTIDDIARLAGVSRTTASMVLNGRAEQYRISAATQERVLATARENNFQPSHSARSLRIGSSNTLGLVIPEDKVLDAIFNEIRDKQSSKKNISVVEGVVIETTDEALNYCRHLTNNEIRLMTLQRIINRDPLSQGIPTSFIPIYNSWPPERQREMFETVKVVYAGRCSTKMQPMGSGAFLKTHIS